jgi:hypothetical protein
MTQSQAAWIKLISLVVGFGGAATAASYTGGAKLWVSVVIGLSTAGMNVYHALSNSPKNQKDQT